MYNSHKRISSLREARGKNKIATRVQHLFSWLTRDEKNISRGFQFWCHEIRSWVTWFTNFPGKERRVNCEIMSLDLSIMTDTTCIKLFFVSLPRVEVFLPSRVLWQHLNTNWILCSKLILSSFIVIHSICISLHNCFIHFSPINLSWHFLIFVLYRQPCVHFFLLFSSLSKLLIHRFQALSPDIYIFFIYHCIQGDIFYCFIALFSFVTLFLLWRCYFPHVTLSYTYFLFLSYFPLYIFPLTSLSPFSSLTSLYSCTYLLSELSASTLPFIFPPSPCPHSHEVKVIIIGHRGHVEDP